MPTTVFDFTVPANYTLTDVGIAGNIASVLRDSVGPSLAKTSTFGVPGDYTYNPALVDVVANQASLHFITPPGISFFAKYGTAGNPDADYSLGVATGTLAAGAVVAGGVLDCSTNGYAHYSAVGNADFPQVGCVKFNYTPLYSGTPASSIVLFNVGSNLSGSALSSMDLQHNSVTGFVAIYVADNTGTYQINGGVSTLWSPVSGQTYLFEVDYDFTAGATRVFIDGVQIGATMANTFTRSAAHMQFIEINSFGSAIFGNINSGPSKFDNIAFYSTVQNTANHAPVNAVGPGYSTANPTIALSTDAISADAILGQITSVTSTTVAAGGDSVTYVVSVDGGATFKYWNGAAWAASAGFVQSNTLAVLNANIATLSVVAGNFELAAYLHSNDGSTTPTLANVTVNYYDFIYGDGSILSNSSFTAQQITSFLTTFSAAGSDTVQFAFEVNGTLKFWNGSSWATSTGILAETNTLAVVQANISTLLAVNSNVKPYILLTSASGTTTPSITDFTIAYNFGVIEPSSPSTTVVYGFLKDIQGAPMVGVSVSFTMSTIVANAYMEAASHVLFPSTVTVLTDANGYFEQPIIATTQFEGSNTRVVVTLTKGALKEIVNSSGNPLVLTIPAQASVDITTLLTA